MDKVLVKVAVIVAGTVSASFTVAAAYYSSNNMEKGVASALSK